jgi:MFS family permease
MKHSSEKYLLYLPYISFFIGIIFYVHQYFLRMSITGISEFVTKTFHINAVTLSLVAATFYYAYALMQLPAGMLVDRYSPRIVITCAAVTVTIGAVICWHADMGADLFAARIFMGLGGSFGFLSILKIANLYFKKESFPLINGATFAIGTAASILAGAPLLALLNTVSWKTLIFYLSIVGLLITLIALIFLRAPIKKNTQHSQDKRKEQSESYKAVLSNVDLWKVALFGGFSFTFITVFAGLWLIPILKMAHPDTPNLAIYGNSLMFLGFGIGALLLGKISQYVKKLKSVMVICSVAILILFLAIVYLPVINLWGQFILIFFLGFSVSATTLSFTYVAKIISPSVSGFAFSIINVCQILIGALMLPLSGYLVKLAKLHHHIPMHTIDSLDYQVAMSVLILSAIITLICAMRLKQ